MNRTSDPEQAVTCTRHRCGGDADFWFYHPLEECWRPFCERHTLQRHPSIEINAWLESGYARPVELGTPVEPPTTPSDDRTAAFRDLVDRAMGWVE